MPILLQKHVAVRVDVRVLFTEESNLQLLIHSQILLPFELVCMHICESTAHYGDHRGRTDNLLVASEVLYQVELRPHVEPIFAFRDSFSKHCVRCAFGARYMCFNRQFKNRRNDWLLVLVAETGFEPVIYRL